jgi:hypothetical protein
MKLGGLFDVMEISEDHKFIFLDYSCKITTLDLVKGVNCTKSTNKENVYEYMEMGLTYNSEKLYLRVKPTIAPIVYSR